MAEIPYHQWLGLDSRIKNPHHFQLLGVSSKVVDADSYRIQVLAAAQAKLEMLDQVEDEANKPVVEKLRQRINTARDVLCDPEKRLDYVKKLKAQIAASKSAKGQLEEPSTKTGSNQKTLKPPQNTPTIKAPVDSRPASKKPNKTTAGTAPQKTPAKPESPPIPMAIPLNPTGKPSEPTAEASPGGPTAVHESPPSVNTDAGDIDLSKLKFKNVRRKKRSKAIPLVLAVVTLGAIASAYWIYANPEKLEVIVRKTPRENSTELSSIEATDVDVDSNTNETKEKAQSATTSSNDLVEIDMESLPILDVDEVMEHPDTLAATNRNLKKQKAKSAQAKKRLAEAGENELVPTANPGKNPSSTKQTPNLDSNKETKKLDASQLAEYRTRMKRVRHSLLRRDGETADQELQHVEKMFGNLLGGEFAIAPQQRGLKELFDATSQSKGLLDGFWEQTVKSCRSIPGGQEIKVGQQILGFVEADDQQVILRNAGANVVYEYEYLPPGLAVVLANQGAIDDVPTWRMQQAAFYSLYADQNPKYGNQVEQLVELAEVDGHDGSGLRIFLKPDIGTIGVPDGRVTIPEREQLVENIADFRSSHEYSEPLKIDPDRAGELAQKLMNSQPENVEQRIANLVEARKLAIRAGNAYLVEDSILGLDVWADLQKNEILTTAYLALSKQKLDMAQSRRLMETAIPFLKSPEVKTSKPKKFNQLIKRLTKIADDNEFVDSKRRLSQIK